MLIFPGRLALRANFMSIFKPSRNEHKQGTAHLDRVKFITIFHAINKASVLAQVHPQLLIVCR